jgi:hypothetical protein
LLLAGGGGLAALLYLLFRRRSTLPTSASEQEDDVLVRAGADGFWIEGSIPAGARVRYACTVRGVPVTDTAFLVGPRTFVYTGGAPVDVRIVEVMHIGDDSPLVGGTPAAPAQRIVARDEDPPPSLPFGGFPPAY